MKDKYLWLALLTDYEKLWVRFSINGLVKHCGEDSNVLIIGRAEPLVYKLNIQDYPPTDLLCIDRSNEPFRGFRSKKSKRQRRN